ncbi:hypothetical protein M407DRAFT_165937 [Tulasnella calospora MUT 4182]|uniref:Uncharacterized protein n=1 Tax=Tulasnella calospora MUT 4182 TaxID=1051891 RepID=A0A0C3QM34_9AGAM|nr:hypothetical protein M407DRAFT_165937 [Tulasnella calospora MUT 4182]
MASQSTFFSVPHKFIIFTPPCLRRSPLSEILPSQLSTHFCSEYSMSTRMDHVNKESDLGSNPLKVAMTLRVCSPSPPVDQSNKQPNFGHIILEKKKKSEKKMRTTHDLEFA